MAGIELNYTGHSTRGASASAAASAGLSAVLPFKQRNGLPCTPLNGSTTVSHLLVP